MLDDFLLTGLLRLVFAAFYVHECLNLIVQYLFLDRIGLQLVGLKVKNALVVICRSQRPGRKHGLVSVAILAMLGRS